WGWSWWRRGPGLSTTTRWSRHELGLAARGDRVRARRHHEPARLGRGPEEGVARADSGGLPGLVRGSGGRAGGADAGRGGVRDLGGRGDRAGGATRAGDLEGPADAAHDGGDRDHRGRRDPGRGRLTERLVGRLVGGLPAAHRRRPSPGGLVVFLAI